MFASLFLSRQFRFSQAGSSVGWSAILTRQGLLHGQGAHENRPMNAQQVGQPTDVSLSPPLSNQLIFKKTLV